ncbi:MAG: WD40/YVTN/BNR-like repeat-containing protein [Caldilineaceae bacterium]
MAATDVLQVAQAGDVLVMVGTRKGTFLFWSDEARTTWQQSHHHLGWSTHAVSYDPRSGAIYAATNSDVFGALVQRSTDGGATWEHFNQGLDFPAEAEQRVRQVWQVQAGHAERPGELWAGTNQAGLFHSTDGGVTWTLSAPFEQRRGQDQWFEGGGGLILHTILSDPQNPDRLYVAVSAGGAYRSDDGGGSWKPVNYGVKADFLPEPHPETGHCVHKMALHPAQDGLLYQQNHDGFYRSDDAGEHWTDITAGLPSRFGFPMAVHPGDAQTVFAAPLVADAQRVMADGQMAVWRTRDGGGTWQQLTNGLPGNAWLNVLRDAMTTDDCASCGVYVGTTGGQVFFSRDEGDSWQMLAEFLPPVLSVQAARVVPASRLANGAG